MLGIKKKNKDRSERTDTYAENKWNFYEAEIENCLFEWPALRTESEEKAKQDCIEYLDQIFQGEFRMKNFRFKCRDGI